MIHVGVDLRQRFCYMTAFEARGKILQADTVTNEKLALRKYFRQFRGKEVQVAVEACGFWPAFRSGTSDAFRTRKRCCSYAGLLPRVRESAGKAARGGITRQGSPWMRWIMVEAAQVATRCSPAAKRYYERLARKKHKHVARVALARKLLIAVYALLHDGVVFDEQKFAAV